MSVRSVVAVVTLAAVRVLSPGALLQAAPVPTVLPAPSPSAPGALLLPGGLHLPASLGPFDRADVLVDAAGAPRGATYELLRPGHFITVTVVPAPGPGEGDDASLAAAALTTLEAGFRSAAPGARLAARASFVLTGADGAFPGRRSTWSTPVPVAAEELPLDEESSEGGSLVTHLEAVRRRGVTVTYQFDHPGPDDGRYGRLMELFMQGVPW